MVLVTSFTACGQQCANTHGGEKRMNSAHYVQRAVRCFSVKKLAMLPVVVEVAADVLSCVILGKSEKRGRMTNVATYCV